MIMQIVFWSLVALTAFSAALMVQFRFLGSMTLRLTLQKTLDDVGPSEAKASVTSAISGKPVPGANETAVAWLRETYGPNLKQLRSFRTGFAASLLGLSATLIGGRLMGLV